MTYLTKCHAYFTGLTIIIVYIIDWLIAAEASPFRNYFLYHLMVPNIWRTINSIPYLIAVIIGSTQPVVLFVNYLGFTIQWALIGLLLSLLEAVS
jgi:hypothetical protein